MSVFERYYRERVLYISPRWARQLRYYIDFWKKNRPRSTEDIVRLLSELEVSNYTRNRYLTVYKAVENWARKKGIRTSLPPSPPYFPNDQKKKPIPPKEVFESIIQAADGSLKPLLILMKNTLARFGELVELKWEDVDLENRLIFLRTRKTGGRGYKNMVIPLNEEAYRVLSSLPRRSEYVFPDVTNSKGMSYRWYALKKACEKAGVQHVSFHSFRHFAATSLAKKGVPLTTIQALCGHSSIKTTEKYLHAYLPDLRSAVELLSKGE